MIQESCHQQTQIFLKRYSTTSYSPFISPIFNMFHVFVLAYPIPQTGILRTPLPPDDVTFGKWPFGKMSGGLGKNSEPLPWSWDLEEFPAPL